MNSVIRLAALNGLKATKASIIQPITFGLGMWLLISMLLFSAFSVVYAKDLSRRLFIQYQGLQHVAQAKQVQWGRLLLEQSTWGSQVRVQTMAQRSGMVTPVAKDIVMVEIKGDNASTATTM